MQLYPHQQRVLDQTKDYERVAYYLDMGLGKTFVGSEKMISFDNHINLLICQKSKIQDWVDHFRNEYRLMMVHDLTQWKVSDFKDDEKFITGGLIAGYRLYIINYELAFRRPDLMRLEDFTLMLDESSLIQNETAKRSKFILNLKPKNVILLSGTPTDGKYENLWSQLHLLGWRITKKRYWEQYVDVNWMDDGSGFKRPSVIGYKNVDRLKAKLAQHGAVFMKSEEAFELPEQNEYRLYVPIPKNYWEFMNDDLTTAHVCDANVKGYATGKQVELIGDMTLTKYLYARQLCGQYHPDKLQRFEDLVESTHDRLIVFYNYNAELSVLEQIALKHDRHVSIVNGQRKDLMDYHLYDDTITFVQYQAGAMGLNLQKANKIIYFTLTDKAALFEQSKKRIHRIGQNRPCFYYYLLCKNSVELNILKTLKMRKDYTDDLFEKTYGKPAGRSESVQS